MFQRSVFGRGRRFGDLHETDEILAVEDGIEALGRKRQDEGHASQQNAATSRRAFQILRAHLYAHATRDFAHGREQGQVAARVLDRNDLELDPEIRKAGDSGSPAVLKGEDSPHAKSLFEFARKVVARVDEIKASSPASVVQIQ